MLRVASYKAKLAIQHVGVETKCGQKILLESFEGRRQHLSLYVILKGT